MAGGEDAGIGRGRRPCGRGGGEERGDDGEGHWRGPKKERRRGGRGDAGPERWTTRGRLGLEIEPGTRRTGRGRGR